MSTPGIAVPGATVPSGALTSPGGAQGIQGIQGTQGTQGLVGDSLPIGAIWAYGALTPLPAGSLLADGSAISRSTYSALFALYGTTYGAGDGATTFNLPDLRGRTIIGQGLGSGLTSRALAAIGGEETHVLSLAELASHSHSITDVAHNHTWNDSGHTHNYTYKNLETVGTGGQAGSSFANVNQTVGSGSNNQVCGYNSASGTGLSGTNANGGGGGHNNMSPFMVLVWLVKVSLAGAVSPSAPLADSTQNGMLRQVSGNINDYVGGDNTCHPLPSLNIPFLTKSAAYTLALTDIGKYIICSGGSWTLTLPAPVSGLNYRLRNDMGITGTTGTITVQPTGGTINGLASLALLPQQECTVITDGTNWRTFELRREVVLGTQDITTTQANGIILLPAGYRQFDLEWTGMAGPSGTSALALYGLFSTDGGNTWLSSSSYYSSYFFLSGASAVAAGSNSPMANAYLGWGIDTAPRGHVKTSLCPGGLGRDPSWHGLSVGYNQAGGFAGRMTVSGFYNGGVVVNALQYYFNSGNISQSFLTVKGVV